MRRFLALPCFALLMCGGSTACAPLHPPVRRALAVEKTIMAKEVVRPRFIVRLRDNYRNHYSYDFDRYARMCRWHDTWMGRPARRWTPREPVYAK